MSDHDTPESSKERRDQLARHFRPHKGSTERKRYDEEMSALWRNPKVREQIKQKSHRADATLAAQQASGAGYPSDVALREFQLDYNNRLKAYGTNYLPTSFAVAEAFFQLRQEFAGFFLLPEEDYLINFADFVDFVTGPDGPRLDVGAATRIKADTIINVNTLESPGEFTFSTDDGHSFAILGASYVRRRDELSMLLVVGEQMSADELAHLAEVAAKPWGAPPKNKPDMTFDNGMKPGVVFVDDAERLVRDIVLCRFNLQNRRIEARCLLRDTGNRYTVTTDIAETLQNGTRDAQEWAERMGDELDKASVVWECAKMLILLPAYLSAKISVLQQEQRTTNFGLQTRNSLKFRRAIDEALPEAKVVFRRISAIRMIQPARAAPFVGRSYTPPAFQVPVSGFWRTYLDPTRQGHDEQGQSITGRTWVKPHLRFKDKGEAEEPKIVYIKASLAHARRTLEQYRAGHPSTEATHRQTEHIFSAVPNPPESAGEAPAGAYVYAMRCPAHGRDIYKVGYTDRDPEQRARELSATTSSPTTFLVVQAWAVTDGQAAEAAAHIELASWRLSDKREFFQVSYASLRESLERAIKPWAIGEQQPAKRT